MKIHIVQHVPFEEPGALLDWAKAEGHQVEVLNPAKDELPSSDETDFLILLGGPMSVHDEKQFPWLTTEKTALKKLIEENKKPVLGICLGAQLIADVLGAKVYNNTEKEIGWFPVQIETTGLFKNVETNRASVFHWHGEIFDLPKGAKLLASSALTPVQAFQHGERVLALQFHPEMNTSALKSLLRECAVWIDPTQKSEQSEEEILRQAYSALAKSQQLLNSILKGF